jgi:hypothetical protein
MNKLDHAPSQPSHIFQGSGFWAIGLVLVALFLVILTSPPETSDQFFHWFVLPVSVCGVLIGIDAVNWLRGRLDVFDPIGVLGAFGFHFFFLAPLLHVSWNLWLEPWYTPPDDWRHWLGCMALFNIVCILVYRWARRFFGAAIAVSTQPMSHRRFIPKRIFWLLGGGMALSLVLQILVYRQFGGIAAYAEAATNLDPDVPDAFKGFGMVFLFSESFPILAMIAYTIVAQRHPRLRQWSSLIIVLVVFVGLQLFFGGLRASRANTIWALFWVVGIIHFWIRPITRRQVTIGVVCLVLFMYLYGFFKGGGFAGVQRAFQGSQERAALEQEVNRDLPGLLLGDLGRSEVQAYTLYRLMRPESDYEYVWGGTYLAGMSILLPSAVLPEKPLYSKERQSTELLYGKGTYGAGRWHSSKIHALAGEVMINFGPWTAPIPFIALGALVAWVGCCYRAWQNGDVRQLLLPVMVNLCFVVLVSDMDNIVFFMFKNCGLPTAIVLIGSRGYPIEPEIEPKIKTHPVPVLLRDRSGGHDHA